MTRQYLSRPPATLTAAGRLWLCGCERLKLAVPVEVSMAVDEERAAAGAIDDLTVLTS